MKSAVAEFSYLVQGRTRSETLDKMDSLGRAIIMELGGAPWVMLDDDVVRVHIPGHALADDQGFAYQGKRLYKFGGPMLGKDAVPSHENFQVQDGVEE